MDGEREDGRVPGEHGGGAVAVVDIAVYHHGPLDDAIGLQAADRDRRCR